MAPPLVYPPHSITIRAQPLTPSAFAPFGTVIQYPSSTPTSFSGKHSPIAGAITVNAGTAQKHTAVTPFTNAYPLNKPRASANVNFFVCKPRKLLPAAVDNVAVSGIFKVNVLERHPYTTQSFIPLGLPAPTRPEPTSSRYLVIVAPSLDSRGNPPDLANIKAFIAYGNQGVTYNVKTWHAPMVVLGKNEIGFVVLVHENQVDGDDLELLNVGGEGVNVEIHEGLWGSRRERAKL